MNRNKQLARLVIVIFTLILAVGGELPVRAQSSELFFSEYIEGSSNNKTLEIFNGTGGPINLAGGGYNVQMYFNGSTTAGLTINLTGTVANGDVFVLAQASANATILAQADQTNGAGWFNGDDAVVLRKGTTVIDVIGQIGVDPGTQWGSGLASTADNTLRRKDSISQGDPNGSDAFDPSIEWDGFDIDTFDGLGCRTGICDDGTPDLETCGDEFTPIYDIQSNGSASPLDGTVVSTEGVVTGDFQTGAKLRGFFIQDATGDGNSATSDGIFVFDGSSPAVDVSVGDTVRVRGTVDEFNTLTELTAVDLVLTCGAGSVAATPVSLPVTDISDFEPFEGMLVTFPQALFISEFFNFDRFGEIVLTTERQFQPTAIVEPGQDAVELAQAYRLRRITLDDGRTSQNPDPAIHPNGNNFDLTNRFRGGDTVQNVTGVLDFAFGLYRIQPTEGADYTPANPRPLQPEDVGGNVKVASFNVLNYFLTIDDGSDNCGPASNPGQECRGADDANEFQRQRDKILSALSAIEADVFGLIEMENTEGVEPLEDIVAGLNQILGPGVYDYINTGTIGTDAIKVGLIYKPGAVTPVGDFAILDSSVDPRFLDDKNRPVLAQSFQDNSTGGIFTVAVNHLKSKGSNCNDVGDPDTGDGSGNCNGTRTLAAQALVDWLATDPTGSGDSDVLIIGDLNSYAKEDPIDAILAANYTDLISQKLGEEAYSFLFDGQLGYLDHALANQALLPEVTGVTEWHINADEPDLLDYDTSFKQDAQDDIYEPNAFRSADHDPVIVGLATCDEIAPTLGVSVPPESLWPPNHKYTRVTATVTPTDNFDPDPDITLLSVTSNEPDSGLDDEDKPNDIVIVDDYTFDLRAERSDAGDGRLYTITYEVKDACGNSTQASATVTVLHDQGQSSNPAPETGEPTNTETPADDGATDEPAETEEGEAGSADPEDEAEPAETDETDDSGDMDEPADDGATDEPAETEEGEAEPAETDETDDSGDTDEPADDGTTDEPAETEENEAEPDPAETEEAGPTEGGTEESSDPAGSDGATDSGDTTDESDASN